MAYVIAEPQLLSSAAAEIEGIGSAISAANAAATGPTSGLLAAAGDEVSAAVAKLFGAYGQQYQAVVAQFEAFHAEFQQTLAAAGNAYAQTEAAIATGLQNLLVAPAASSAAPNAASIPPFSANLTSLFVGPTGVPIPSLGYVLSANKLFVRSLDLLSLHSLYTPEELYPLTGVKSLVLNRSLDEGLTILDNAIRDQLRIPGNTVTVFGYSQSAMIASLEMRNLASLGPSAPTAAQLNFVLVGNEMNPNGGMLARFPGLNISALGLTFLGATPSDTIYPTAIYTQEYDGFADFPRYPLNVISDLNALMGIPFVHTKYLDLTVEQVNNAIPLHTSQGYSGVTNYYVIHTDNLPLLAPLRALPVIGEPLADLIQPNLKVIVNLGYGDPNFGYSTSPADVPTPFGLFPDVRADTVFNALGAGTQQGIHDFTADLPTMFSKPIVFPPFEIPSIVPGPVPPPPPPLSLTPTHVANTIASIVSTNYAVLLPTADIGLSLLTTAPAYNADLFVDQLMQGNLINAIGYPIAADVGLLTIGATVEFLTLASAASDTIQDIQRLIP
ncbi:PE family protein [Mycobacterium angelicum]|uniref:PE family protein n=1 Tax=Mycobacterium angelicum TaxID=470074 RepID=A0A1W9ZTT9_MYCAN|nr:PE-PPE domain-containing protein [Mycobacterium angelicum]MCV7198205.1 PE-PPE domain-containing protein [Mycobacterium angelicum]ORA21204.1 PE family protein [Mycobacterium angelicum]